PNVGDVRAHLLVHGDRARIPEPDAGGFGELRARFQTDGHEQEVAPDDLLAVRLNRPDAAPAVAVERDRHLAADDDAGGADGALERRVHLPAERLAEELASAVEDRHADPALAQHLRHLDPDVPAADDDGVPDGLGVEVRADVV